MLSKVALSGTVALTSFLSLQASALAEGSAQIGTNQPLMEYGVQFVNSATGIFSDNHAIYVDITNPGEVINVSVCGRTNDDDVRIEIYSTSPNIADPVLVPTTGTQLFAQTFANSNIDCANPMTGNLTTPLQFPTPGTGTYEVRLFNVSQGGTRDILERVDVTVTPNTSAAVDPTARQGRIYAYSWAYDANGYTVNESADTDYFIKVPGGRPGENFVWRLDLNNFAGFVYEIIANHLGIDPPYQGLSADFVEDGNLNNITPRFPLYLSHPEVVGVRPTIPPEVIDFKFTDNQGVDNSISPGFTGGVQDSGTFSFNTDVDGTFVVIIDADGDGQFAPSASSPKDTFLFGTAVPGSNSIVWDGTDNEGNVLPAGTYSAQLQVRIGEFHFIASDAETSGGGVNDGLTVFESLADGVDADTLVFWDDMTLLGDSVPPGQNPTTLPTGQPSSSALSRHTWGDNNTSGTGFGNRRMIDTYVYGDSTIRSSAVIIGPSDVPVERDYGDAPDTGPNGTDTTNYDTTDADGGPNHVIVPELSIGTAPDADDGTQQNPAADADDTNGNDEGLITFEPLQTDTTTYTLNNIAVTNSTGSSAFLTGWIDFDQSGTFDNDELASATVAAGDTTATLEWSATATNPVPPDITLGTTYARFRYSSINLVDPVGDAADGEVEDYRITILQGTPELLLTKRITAINRALSGEQLFETSYIDVGTTADNDNAINWPGGTVAATVGGGTVESYIAGIAGADSATAVAGVATHPGDHLEYTVSFLSNGNGTANNVLICDRIPTHTTFDPTAFNSATPAAPGPGDRGIFLSFNGQDVALTNANDGDEIADTGGNDNGIGGYYFPPGTNPSTELGVTINCGGTNDNGAIVVDLSDIPNATGEGTPVNSFGSIQFRAIVD